MLSTFSHKITEQTKKISINKVIEIMVVLIVMFIFMIAGAIVGAIMYSALK